MDNWQAIIYLLASGQGLLLTLALLSQINKKNKSGFFLGLILLILSLELLNAWGMQVRYHSQPNVIPFWLIQSYLILPPAIWLFMQFNLHPNFTFKKNYLLLFLPACIEIITESTTSLIHKFTGHHIRMLDYGFWWFLTEFVPVIWTALVLGVFVLALLKYARSIPTNQTKGFQLHLFKLWTFFAYFLLLTILWSLGSIIELQIFFWIELMLTFLLFVLGYIGYLKPDFFENPVTLPQTPVKIPSFEQYDDQKTLQKLNLIFNEESIHTQSKLSLKILAQKLKLPPRYVSYLINTYHAQNFHQFVNTYRVKEVITKIKDPKEQHKTLLALALESGFNSKSSFNQVFKDHTGYSPSEYLQKMG